MNGSGGARVAVVAILAPLVLACAGCTPTAALTPAPEATSAACARLVVALLDRLSGEERFTRLEASVREFWRFALGDLRMNNARGYLAEFLVARALGVRDPQRIEWAEYDVLLGDIRIEVKSSAYLQAWEQRQLSRIAFSGLKGTPYNPRSGYDPAGRQYNAEVYVFGVQTALTHDAYDPLDVSQWEWHVLPRSVLARLGQATISLATLRAHTQPVELETLEAAVRAAASTDREPETPHAS